MNKILSLILFFGTNICLSQDSNLNNFRIVKGIVEDDFGPIVGSNIMVKGTNYGVTSDLEGKFCLLVPINKTIYLENRDMRIPTLICISPNKNEVRFFFNKKKEYKKIYKKFLKEGQEYVSFLNEFYANSSLLEKATNCN